MSMEEDLFPDKPFDEQTVGLPLPYPDKAFKVARFIKSNASLIGLVLSVAVVVL